MARCALRRGPYLLETSRPGVFAVGDIRAGGVKRVASEGSMAVQFVHKVLAESRLGNYLDIKNLYHRVLHLSL